MESNKFLDCTVRDGGYLNNWNFTEEEVCSYYKAALDAGYDYFEIGYRDNLKSYANKDVGMFKRVTDDMISKIKNSATECKRKASIAIMVNQTTFDVEDFTSAEKCDIDLIRIATHKATYVEACINAKKFMDLGYTVSLNAMASIKYTDEDIANLAKCCQKYNVPIIYVADSFGSLKAKHAFHFKKIFDETISLLKSSYTYEFGMHAHNNLDDALEKTTAVMDEFTYLDSTIGGIGRGAGNLASENLMSYMIKERNAQSVNFNLLVSTANEICHKMNFNVNRPLFCASAHFDIHPNYVIKQLEYNLSTTDIVKVLSMVTVTEFKLDHLHHLITMNKLKFVIPARYDSSRLPGKLMMMLGDKTILQRTYEQVLKSQYAHSDNVVIVCDGTSEIINDTQKYNAKIHVVSSECHNGTERIAKYLKHLTNLSASIIINVQADEPYVNPTHIDCLIESHLKTGMDCTITHYKPTDETTVSSMSNIKSVCNDENIILYSSRNIIPRKKDGSMCELELYQIFSGIYAYNCKVIMDYDKSLQILQKEEDIEHLSLIEQGYRVGSCILSGSVEHGVNTLSEYNDFKSRYSDE